MELVPTTVVATSLNIWDRRSGHHALYAHVVSKTDCSIDDEAAGFARKEHAAASERRRKDELVALAKINCEGCEYAVLLRLVETGAVRRFRTLVVRPHLVACARGPPKKVRRRSLIFHEVVIKFKTSSKLMKPQSILRVPVKFELN